ncbi:hypothetical protein [Streptomyces sp. NPDC088727]|uniref:hypothetical protein n=1 Tax=Streptomyces sp. NPDC088727 TaxID=3365875 RepID=UPI00381CD0AC
MTSTAELIGQAVIDAVTDADTYEVDYYPEGRAPHEGERMTGPVLRELLNRFKGESWGLHGTRELFKAQRSTTGAGAEVYELRLAVDKETTGTEED